MFRTTGTTMRMTKNQAQKTLSNVPEEKIFWSHDGQIFRSLHELESGFNRMTEETYKYHANAAKNDFSNWVREVIGDDTLAKDLEKAPNRLDAAMKVESRIHYLISVR